MSLFYWYILNNRKSSSSFDSKLFCGHSLAKFWNKDLLWTPGSPGSPKSPFQVWAPSLQLKTTWWPFTCQILQPPYMESWHLGVRIRSWFQNLTSRRLSNSFEPKLLDALIVCKTINWKQIYILGKLT